MKRISLRPYAGQVFLFPSLAALLKYHKKCGGTAYEPSIEPAGVTMSLRSGKEPWTHLVWAASPTAMAHEMSHVALNVFEDIGSNPVECNGEPFCYLLEQLLEDSAP